MPLDTTLLDLNRAPTIKEMQAFFKKHDLSAAVSRTTFRRVFLSAQIRIFADKKKMLDREWALYRIDHETRWNCRGWL